MARQLTGLPTVTRLEPYLTPPGVFGSNCGLHISLTKTRHFQGDGVRLPGVGGPMKGLSFHDLLVDWLNNGNPGEVQVDNSIGPPTHLPFARISPARRGGRLRVLRGRLP